MGNKGSGVEGKNRMRLCVDVVWSSRTISMVPPGSFGPRSDEPIGDVLFKEPESRLTCVQRPSRAAAVESHLCISNLSAANEGSFARVHSVAAHAIQNKKQRV